jgi:MFS family permease
MNRDLGVWTSEDSALVLIDYQAELLEAIRSETAADLVELNARWLAKTAKAFDMPIVLSSGGVGNGIFAPTQPAILAELPDVEPIDRSTMNVHRSSHALAGAVLFAIFSASVAAQFLTMSWPFTRDSEVGMAAMVIGLGLAVLAVWVRPPSLALFIAGGVLMGGGGGAVFKGAMGTVMEISSPDRIAESVAGVLLAAFVGLSLPVVGAGVMLASHVSPKVTILGFAIAVSVGIAASAVKLAGGPNPQAPAPGWR